MNEASSGRDSTMSSNSGKPTRVRDFLPYLPLLFFIFWESGVVHSYFQLMTPMNIVSLVSGLSLLIFFAWGKFEKARVLGIPIFFMLFLLRNPVPYIFLLLVVVYYFYRNEYLLKTIFILIPLTIAEALGIGLDIRITLLITLIFFLIAARYSLGDGLKARVKPLTKGILYASLILLLISISPIDPLAREKDSKIAYDGFHHKLDSAFFENDTITHSTLRYLNSIGYNATILEEPISSESLKDVSILILETPEETYTPQEINYITDFVNNGGGLFVLGDHTNIMDCYATLNPILHKFGLHLNFDYSMLWEPHFSSLANFDSTEETAGATLKVNKSDALIFYALKYTTWADQGDWTATNHAYMGDVVPQRNEQYGVLPICAAANYGKGRVVAIANSDSMSGSNLIYNYDFITKVMGYLNYENSFFKITWFQALLVVLAMFGIFRARLGAILPLIVSLALVLVLVQIQAVIPTTPEPANMIALDIGHTNIEGYGYPHQYKNVFFSIFAQHYGFNPILTKEVPKDLEKYKAYVTMGPTSSFSPEEVERLRSYVQNGGSLVVFDGYHSDTPANTSSNAANSLVKNFGLYFNGSLLGDISYFNYTTWGFNLPYMQQTRIQTTPQNDPLMKDIGGNITMYSAVEVLGGTPLALYNDTTPVMATQKLGKGRIIVVGDHTIFREFVRYEPVFAYPDPNLKKFIENLFVSIGGREENGI
jgi:uncharacterized membrane protein